MNKLSVSTTAPVILDSPRAWRTYTGGALLDQLHGVSSKDAADTNFPEEWIMSVVEARNAGREEMESEGLSHLAADPSVSLRDLLHSDPEGFLGEEFSQVYGAHPGVLAKLIDSSERLTIQVHPDKKTAARLFSSPFGKTECWHILGGRQIGDETPCVYVGFREGITRERWEDLFRRQDIAGMLQCLHRFDVQKGDTILIEGGVPHAIGAGCFLVEIQEPTDYTIRVERTTPSGLAVADSMCHQGLGFSRMFDCFHYEGVSRKEAQPRWFIPAKPLPAGRLLIGEGATDLFSLKEYTPAKGQEIHVDHLAFSGLYVLQGEGVLQTGGHSCVLTAPMQIFLPAGIKDYTIRSSMQNPLRILEFHGPRINRYKTLLQSTSGC